MAPSTRVVGLFSGPMPRHGATQVNDLISLAPVNEDQRCTYFCGVQPVFQHPPGNRPSFRMFKPIRTSAL